MTDVAARAAPPARAQVVRVLAGVEGRRYARDPFFLTGAGGLLVLMLLLRPELDADPSSVAGAAEAAVIPAFWLGFLGILVGFRLTRSMVGVREPVEATPTEGVLRTAALCLACLVPGTVALACYAWMDGRWLPPSPAVSSADRFAFLFTGVLYAVGGPLLGILVGRWARFPGAGLLAAIAVFGWVQLSMLSNDMPSSRWSTLLHLHAPFVLWSTAPGEADTGLISGSPQWYLVYITLLCGLAATGAMLHEAAGQQRTRLLRALLTLAVLALAALGLATAPHPAR